MESINCLNEEKYFTKIMAGPWIEGIDWLEVDKWNYNTILTIKQFSTRDKKGFSQKLDNYNVIVTINGAFYGDNNSREAMNA